MPGVYSSPVNTSFFSFKGIFHYEAFAYSGCFKKNHFKRNDKKPISLSEVKQNILENHYTLPLSWNCTEKLVEKKYSYFAHFSSLLEPFLVGGLLPLFWQPLCVTLFSFSAPLLSEDSGVWSVREWGRGDAQGPPRSAAERCLVRGQQSLLPRLFSWLCRRTAVQSRGWTQRLCESWKTQESVGKKKKT